MKVTQNDKNTWTLIVSEVTVDDGGYYMCQINSEPMLSEVGLHVHFRRCTLQCG